MKLGLYWANFAANSWVAAQSPFCIHFPAYECIRACISALFTYFLLPNTCISPQPCIFTFLTCISTHNAVYNTYTACFLHFLLPKSAYLLPFQLGWIDQADSNLNPRVCRERVQNGLEWSSKMNSDEEVHAQMEIKDKD
ncbi:hypothetical protein R3W88_000882 [Solanum pinnatisectum]|uniref:Uncharacterized protein n=1 Tax=Solanum pinnatisectum TaxID=50273 RepID=A0AAV9MGQ4_9SOLN|nr:hypothetical protein R3W88_000882 [Solanum pinnatisectum]